VTYSHKTGIIIEGTAIKRFGAQNLSRKEGLMKIAISASKIKTSLTSKLILASATQFDFEKRQSYHDKGIALAMSLWSMDGISDTVYFGLKDKFAQALKITDRDTEIRFDYDLRK
jgi:hypothetical protein